MYERGQLIRTDIRMDRRDSAHDLCITFEKWKLVLLTTIQGVPKGFG